ncbi:MAG: response regulator [Desulfococcaceae bacterium]|jgi:CheY-like chemotaxis protein|nr:response regulator [Desulfococcaceae bacterium]
MDKQIVLIVDDELDMRIFLSTLFETSGFKAISAKNGSEGIEKAKAHHPDLITLDIMMPGEGGVFMYQQLRTDEQLAKIPVIMLSAIANKTFSHYLKMLNARLGGAVPDPDAYMEKPPEAEELRRVAASLLSKK